MLLAAGKIASRPQQRPATNSKADDLDVMRLTPAHAETIAFAVVSEDHYEFNPFAADGIWQSWAIASHSRWLLRTVPQIVQDATSMVGIVRGAKLLANDMGCSRTRPKVGSESRPQRTCVENLNQLVFQLERRGPQMRHGDQSRHTTFAPRSFPTLHAG